jgi:hypothetical protein
MEAPLLSSPVTSRVLRVDSDPFPSDSLAPRPGSAATPRNGCGRSLEGTEGSSRAGSAPVPFSANDDAGPATVGPGAGFAS